MKKIYIINIVHQFRHHNKLPHVKCKYLAVQIFTFIDIVHKFRHKKLPHVKCKFLSVKKNYTLHKYLTKIPEGFVSLR